MHTAVARETQVITLKATTRVVHYQRMPAQAVWVTGSAASRLESLVAVVLVIELPTEVRAANDQDQVAGHEPRELLCVDLR